MINNESFPVPQSRSVSRRVEDAALGRVLCEQQRLTIRNVVIRTIPDPYDRMVITLHALDGWRPEQIAECAGVSRDDIVQKIQELAPSVLEAIKRIKN